MAASWEIDHRSVLMAVIHTETTTIAWANGLRNLILPGRNAIIYPSGMPYCHARNSACMAALEFGASHLFFMDSDVIVPPDTVLRLLSHDKDVVSGVYCRRSPPHGVPVAIRNGQWLTQFRQNALEPVDYVGAGCLLIKRCVLEQMKPLAPGKHWFHWRVDLKGTGIPDNECLSEDFAFCSEVKKQLGVQVYLDTGVQARHVGFSQATLGNLLPMHI